MAKFKVTMTATLPATAYMTVEAKNADAAGAYAYAHFRAADWDGAEVTSMSCSSEAWEEYRQSDSDRLAEYAGYTALNLDARCDALFCHAERGEGDRLCAVHREEFDAEEAV